MHRRLRRLNERTGLLGIVFERSREGRLRDEREVHAHDAKDVNERDGKIHHVVTRDSEPLAQGETVEGKGGGPVDYCLGDARAARREHDDGSVCTRVWKRRLACDRATHGLVNARGTRVPTLRQHALRVGDGASRLGEPARIRGNDELRADEADCAFEFSRPGCRGKQCDADVQELGGTEHHGHVHDVGSAQGDGRPGAQPELLCKIPRERDGPLPDLAIGEAGVSGHEQALIRRRLAPLFYPPQDGQFRICTLDLLHRESLAPYRAYSLAI